MVSAICNRECNLGSNIVGWRVGQQRRGAVWHQRRCIHVWHRRRDHLGPSGVLHSGEGAPAHTLDPAVGVRGLHHEHRVVLPDRQRACGCARCDWRYSGDRLGHSGAHGVGMGELDRRSHFEFGARLQRRGWSADSYLRVLRRAHVQYAGRAGAVVRASELEAVSRPSGSSGGRHHHLHDRVPLSQPSVGSCGPASSGHEAQQGAWGGAPLPLRFLHVAAGGLQPRVHFAGRF